MPDPRTPNPESLIPSPESRVPSPPRRRPAFPLPLVEPASTLGRYPPFRTCGHAGHTAARSLCNLSLRTASGPEGSSAKQILTCAAGHPGRGGVRSGASPPSYANQHANIHTRNSACAQLPGSRPQVASAALRGRDRPARRHPDAAQRDHRKANRAVVRVLRAAWRRQDDDRPDPGPLPQLRERADPGSLRRVRRVRRDRAGTRHRRDGDRRGDEYAGRQGPRDHHQRPQRRAGQESLQDLHHR